MQRPCFVFAPREAMATAEQTVAIRFFLARHSRIGHIILRNMADVREAFGFVLRVLWLKNLCNPCDLWFDKNSCPVVVLSHSHVQTFNFLSYFVHL